MNYIDYLQDKGMVIATIQRHQSELNKYRAYLATYHYKLAETATKKEVLAYLKQLKEVRQLSPTTRNQVLNILRHYYSYLGEYYQVNNPTVLLKIRGIKRRELRPLFTAEELEMLCECYHNAIQNYIPTNKELYYYPDYQKILTGRYLALTLMAYQGLQTSEVLTLSKDDFDLRKATLHIRSSKRGAARTLKLQACQMGAVFLFFNGNNTSILPNSNQLEQLSKTLKSLTTDEGTKFMDYRQLRASRITYWIQTEGLRKAQHLAGHRHINTTENYKANDFAQLQESLANFHPLQ